MTSPASDETTFPESLDAATVALVRLAAQLAGGDPPAVREALLVAHEVVPRAWVEELVLQTYLFAGFPRTLNGMREWRRIAGPPPDAADVAGTLGEWQAAGEATCEAVYGRMYGRLRENIMELHPALDAWMITDGYGKVLSRPGLDLGRRELCIVAACAATAQDRQLHSHLHGALNVGVPPRAVRAALDALDGVVDAGRLTTARLLLERVLGK